MSLAAGLGDFMLLLSRGCPPWPSLHSAGRHGRRFGWVKATSATPKSSEWKMERRVLSDTRALLFAPAFLQSWNTRLQHTKSPFVASLTIGRVFALDAGVLF